MQPSRGVKKSPFVGRSEPLGNNNILLYPRYQAVSDLLVAPKGQEGSSSKGKPVEGTAANGKHKLPETAPPETTLLNINGTANGKGGLEIIDGLSPVEEEDRPAKRPKREKKKKEKKVKERVLISGSGNQEEAQHIRGVFGFTPTLEAPDKVPDKVPGPQTFSFSFGLPAGSADGAQEAAPTAMASAPAPSPLASTTAMSPTEPSNDRHANGGSANSGASAGDSLVPRRVFVGGMPFSLEEDDIREYWTYCGEIEEMDLMRFPDTGRFKGIAFITFKTEEACQAALDCNDTEVDGQHIRVERCKSAGYKAKGGDAPSTGPSKPPPPKKPAEKTAGYHVAYVGNIAFAVGAPELHELFKECNVKKVRLHTDRHTGQSKGFAHVHFKDEAALDQAMALDGSELSGRHIKMASRLLLEGVCRLVVLGMYTVVKHFRFWHTKPSSSGV
ncbi:hypothetical protein WJX84_003840 [Apatococcus fuscideae]|uniref:RRM domain-containing protein n=1 Tax=Apatococcus fuscideae TaxID=2026836 RepID=A0AAW1TDN6_9CHLO